MTPNEGEKIVTLTIKRNGKLEQSRVDTVGSRNGLAMSTEEFSLLGERRNARGLFPEGKPCGGVAPLGMFPTSVFIYAREADVDLASAVLKAHFICVHTAALAELETEAAEIRAALAACRE